MIAALTQQPSALWYFARAAGFVSLVMLAATVCLGLALTLRWRSSTWPPFISEGLHRYLSTVLFSFIAIHVVTIWLDPFTHFGLADVLVPFATTYRTLWTGLGICAAELALVLGLSIHVRKWIGYRAWRAAHYLTYVIFPVAFIHALGTGSDNGEWWALSAYTFCGVAVVVPTLARLLGGGATNPTSAGARPPREHPHLAPLAAPAQGDGR